MTYLQSQTHVSIECTRWRMRKGKKRREREAVIALFFVMVHAMLRASRATTDSGLSGHKLSRETYFVNSNDPT